MSVPRLLLIAAVVSLGGMAHGDAGATNDRDAAPGPAKSDLAFVWWGEPDPTGVDQAFLALARRRGAAALRETPGHVAEETLSGKLSRALSLYQALDFKGALGAFDDVEREAVARGGGTLSSGELGDLYAYRAAAYSALGDEADAWDDLTEAAALAPGRPLDPARFPPRIVEAARRAREALGTVEPLTVVTAPADGLVIVDGQLYGRGRVEVPRPPGRHFVRVERAGFVPAGQVVEIEAAPREVHLTLAAAPAPTAAALARRGALVDAKRTVGAFVGGGARATVTLLLVDAAGAVLGKSEVGADEQVTSGALAAAVDALLGTAAGGAAIVEPARPWYKRPLVWGIIGGAAAVALGVGLGVGLMPHESGVATRVDLGPAR